MALPFQRQARGAHSLRIRPTIRLTTEWGRMGFARRQRLHLHRSATCTPLGAASASMGQRRQLITERPEGVTERVAETGLRLSLNKARSGIGISGLSS